MNTEQRLKDLETIINNASNAVNELKKEYSKPVVGAKDPWDGVEFARCVNTLRENKFTIGKIYRMVDGKKIHDLFALIDNDNNKNGFAGENKKYFTPSTEQEYVDHLKKEFWNRYDIKNEPLKFKHDFKGGSLADKETPFRYNKIHDTLYYHGEPVYQLDVWANKVEKCTVEPVLVDIDWPINKDAPPSVMFKFKLSKKPMKEVDARCLLKQVAEFMEQKLNEKHEKEQLPYYKKSKNCISVSSEPCEHKGVCENCS